MNKTKLTPGKVIAVAIMIYLFGGGILGWVILSTAALYLIGLNHANN